MNEIFKMSTSNQGPTLCSKSMKMASKMGNFLERVQKDMEKRREKVRYNPYDLNINFCPSKLQPRVSAKKKRPKMGHSNLVYYQNPSK
jgi:hypothetical protein